MYRIALLTAAAISTTAPNQGGLGCCTNGTCVAAARGCAMHGMYTGYGQYTPHAQHDQFSSYPCWSYESYNP